MGREGGGVLILGSWTAAVTEAWDAQQHQPALVVQQGSVRARGIWALLARAQETPARYPRLGMGTLKLAGLSNCFKLSKGSARPEHESPTGTLNFYRERLSMGFAWQITSQVRANFLLNLMHLFINCFLIIRIYMWNK